jgi:BirA family transcriptional regulator, biotin operon repressor / biotin---[acetyl-CoA-carboxylase] ligase
MSKKLKIEKIKKSLREDSIFSDIIILDSVVSTQDYIFKNIEGLQDRAVLLAEEQTGGYGRMGRVWRSSYCKGLYMSILFKSRVQYCGLTMLGSLSLCGYLSKEYGLDFKMRWPNDVICQDRKIAGVLANIRADAIALGFGINLNQSLSELPEMGSSLSLIRNREVDRDLFLAGFLNHFQRDLDIWEVESFKYLREIWSEHTLFKGKEVTARTRSGIMKGVVEDITEDYGLIIRTEMGYKTILNLQELIKIR